VSIVSGEPWEIGQRGSFRGRFGEDVDAYDRTRPVAPDGVFDELVAAAGLRPGAPVVEIGPGTGQATRPLATRGLQVLALEVDGRLAARARENLADLEAVSVVTSPFEAWDPDGARFSMVFACNSFHWIEPEVGFAKAAAVLHDDGVLALLSTPVVVPDGASSFWWEVQDDWEAITGARLDPATRHPDVVSGLATVDAPEWFQAPDTSRSPFDVVMTANDYVLNMSTQSGVKQLPPPAQLALLQRIERRIEAQGGTVKVHHLAILEIARRQV
jgi:SAM-dependent methyltransferase